MDYRGLVLFFGNEQVMVENPDPGIHRVQQAVGLGGNVALRFFLGDEPADGFGGVPVDGRALAARVRKFAVACLCENGERIFPHHGIRMPERENFALPRVVGIEKVLADKAVRRVQPDEGKD